MKKLILSLFLFIGLFSVNAQNATINFEITDLSTNALTPSKLIILQEDEPFEHGLSSTDDLACRGHTVYSRTGKGSFELPAGQYQIWVGKGMEYSIDVQDYIIDRGQKTSIKVGLERELNPKGYIGGDMHLHTYTFSGHGDANVEERLISCAAEGLEWAVSTDHNAVLDYTPYMKKLGLEDYFSTSVGNEVSTKIGHFNTYPLAADSEKTDSKYTVGKELFEAIRKNGIDHTLIQINHPRWVDSDFFNTKGLDPFYGTSKHPEWDLDFDAFEVLNENFGIGWRDAPDNKFSVKEDWFNLLNHGLKKTGLGNSDSHSVIAQIAGVPRNYIQSSTDIPKEINEIELSQNIVNQRVSVACGLFVNLIANSENGIGSTVKLTDEEQELTLDLLVQAPSWVSCHKVELIENGVVIQTFDIPKSKEVNRLKKTITLKPKKDSWYVLIAYGDQPMAPMVQGKKKPVLPIGFTNPIWVDADGDAQITSVYDYSEKLIKELNGKPADLVDAMKADRALVYPIFYHLFENKDSMITEVTMNFLHAANTRQKQLLYRELSKIGTPIATNILRRQKRTRLTPLEEIVLNYYLEFPLHENKVERFKKSDNSNLDEQLNWLEDIFRFAQSGATKKELHIARSNYIKNAATAEWTKITQSENSILPIGELLKEREGKFHYIHYPLFAKMDTAITFYLSTNATIQVSRRGQLVQSFSRNERFPFAAKMVKINLIKGENDLLFRIEGKDDAYISLQEINPNKLLDPSLKDTKTVEHLAIDSPVKYLVEYVPKYHGHGIALTDGYRGTTSIGSQLWQGWNGENAEFIIDLGSQKTIDAVTVGILIDQKSWIFSPKSIQCSFSDDGINFSAPLTQELVALTEQVEASIKDIEIKVPSKKARYVKVLAKKINALPEWHAGKGGDAWIALDEVLVE